MAVTLIILLDLEAIGRIEQLDNISEVTDDIPPQATVTEASNLLELFNWVGKYVSCPSCSQSANELCAT